MPDNGHLLAEPYLPAHDPLGQPIASSQHPYHVPPGRLPEAPFDVAEFLDHGFDSALLESTRVAHN
jgi:hypothetical protein